MNAKTTISRLDELLKPRGFSRHKAVWNRKTDSFVDVIDVQTSKAGDSITINAGVLNLEVHKLFSNAEPKSFIEEPLCTVRTRIGLLFGDKDIWWRLSEPQIEDDIAEKLSAHVLPFLDRMHSIEAMEQFLIDAQVNKQKYPLPIIFLALLRNERGDKTSACSMLSDLRKTTVSAWQARVDEIMERLGCT